MAINLTDIGIQSVAVTEATSFEVNASLKAVGPVPTSTGGFAFAGKVDPTRTLRIDGAGDLPAALDNLGTTSVAVSNHDMLAGVQITQGIDENESIDDVNRWSVEMMHFPGAS